MLAWLTPDSTDLIGDPRIRTIEIPGHLFSYISGALMMLAESENWEENGDATPEEMSQFFSDVFDEYATSEFKMVGQMAVFAGGAVGFPFGWIRCFGQTINQADYPELTAVVPPVWKSGSIITLPDMRGQTVVGRGTHPTHGLYPVGSQGGTRTETLTTTQMPAHVHNYYLKNSTVLAAPGALPVVAPINTAAASDTEGGSSSHNNMPPYVALDWAIYAGR